MKDFKWFLVTLVILMIGLLVWMFVDTACAEPYRVCTVNAGGGLNVRVGPGTEYHVAFMLADEAEVVVLETRDNWSLVHFKSLINLREPMGWVCSDYLIEKYIVNLEVEDYVYEN